MPKVMKCLSAVVAKATMAKSAKCLKSVNCLKLGVIAIALVWPSFAQAERCRCQNGYIYVGAHKAEVLDTCGEPDRVFEAGEDRTGRRGDRRVRYSEDWEYRNLGGCVVRIFVFRGNELIKIEEYRK